MTDHSLPQATEGVIKFRLDFHPALPPASAIITELNAWRTLLYRLALTGRHPRRYGGLAYGNVSQRETQDRFFISGTQTAHKERLTVKDYCLVLDFDLQGNWIRAEGPIRPSSEALTHAAIYAANAGAKSVLHVHSPEIWEWHRSLGIPATRIDIAYGTPEMARAIQEAMLEGDAPIICMRGHQDGVIAFGRSAEEATLCLVQHLGRAFGLASPD